MRQIPWRIVLIVLETLYGSECFRPPDFRSEWLPLQAQGGPASIIDAEHGLGVVPDLVEVLVKVIEGENKDFIFKAMGSSNKDDDELGDIYGRVVYFYNDQLVRVMAPTRSNEYDNGGAIYTGGSPYWKGINSQFSMAALIQVRCWTSSSLPSPCFHSAGASIQTGRTAGDSSYMELSHGLGWYPEVLTVRAKLTNGNMAGWYCNGQGSVVGQLSLSERFASTTKNNSGLHFGYDTDNVRIWASSHGYDKLCESMDGWPIKMKATKGEIEVTAWCDLGLTVTNKISINLNPSTSNGDLELQLARPSVVIDNVLLSLMVRVNSGPNAGFLFEGIGSASSSLYGFNTNPCDYGGIIYAYSASAIRMWMPDPVHRGAAVCITEGYGNGRYSQAATDVTVIINVRQWALLHTALEPLPKNQDSCVHFYLEAMNVSYSASVMNQHFSSSAGDCGQLCHRYEVCTTFAFKDYLCKIYDLFDKTHLVSEVGSEVWTTGN